VIDLFAPVLNDRGPASKSTALRRPWSEHVSPCVRRKLERRTLPILRREGIRDPASERDGAPVNRLTANDSFGAFAMRLEAGDLFVLDDYVRSRALAGPGAITVAYAWNSISKEIHRRKPDSSRCTATDRPRTRGLPSIEKTSSAHISLSDASIGQCRASRKLAHVAAISLRRCAGGASETGFRSHQCHDRGLRRVHSVLEGFPCDVAPTTNGVVLDETVTEVEFRNVVLAYGGEIVLKNVSLDLRAGELIGIAGPSGAGKTTIMYAIPQFIPLDAGDLLINGKSVAARRPHRMRERIGFVFQQEALFSS
jgi:hypothetical protein